MCYAFVALTAGLLVACGGGGGGGVSPTSLPVVMANGQPVEGIHYIRSDDDSMLESEPTDAEGKVNPRLPDNTESAQIIFAVGPITLATVRNGIREFDFDTENGGFEIGRVSRPTRGWSGIDFGDLLEWIRYLNFDSQCESRSAAEWLAVITFAPMTNARIRADRCRRES